MAGCVTIVVDSVGVSVSTSKRRPQITQCPRSSTWRAVSSGSASWQIGHDFKTGPVCVGLTLRLLPVSVAETYINGRTYDGERVLIWDKIMPVDLGNQFGVALLSLLGALLLRRFNLGARIHALVPLTISISLFWLFVKPPTLVDALLQGGVAGLLASGMLYVIMGLVSSGD